MEYYNQQIKEDAIKNFEEFVEENDIERIKVNKLLQNEIGIFGYNKFSRYPK